MLLTIHNLPIRMRHADVKALIVSKCGFKEVILDNLVVEDGRSKKVTVGLVEEEDAAMLMRQINGLYVEGNQLYVKDIRKKKTAQQPYRQTQNYESSNFASQQNNQPSSLPNQSTINQQAWQMLQQNYRQPFCNQGPGFQPRNLPLMMPMGGLNMGGMYYTLPGQQNAFVEYTGQSQLPSSSTQYQSPDPQGQTGSGNVDDSRNDDNWSRKRREHTSQKDDEWYGNRSSNESDSGQRSGAWGNVTSTERSRRRSRSPHNRRERSRGSYSPKRAKIDDNYGDSSRLNSYADSQGYPSNRDSYTSQDYGSQYLQYYDQDPATATSSNAQTYQSAQRQRSSETRTSNYQQGSENRYSSAPFEDNSRKSTWDKKETVSSDPKSNYRKHLEMKEAEKYSNKPYKNIGDSRYKPSYGADSISKYKWTNSSFDKNAPNSSSRRSPDKNWEPPKRAPAGKYLGKTWLAKPNKGKLSMMPTIRQDSKARYKAAGDISAEIASDHSDIIKKEHLKHLRQSVRSRLEILLAERLGDSAPVMISVYRGKFPKARDREFCQLIVKQVESELKTGANPETSVDLTGADFKNGIKQEKPSPQKPAASKNQPKGQLNNQPKGHLNNQPKGQMNNQPTGQLNNQPKSQPKNQQNNQPKNQPKQKKKKAGNIQPVLPHLHQPEPGEKLPKYPNASKTVYQTQKKIKKLEFGQEDLYKLSPLMDKELERQLNIISKLYKSVTSEPDTEAERELCDRFVAVGLERVRKAIKLQVTKRILNITTNLIVRVFVYGKVSKPQVELFLREQKVVSVKKCSSKSKAYVATCGDWDTYDRLLDLHVVELGKDQFLKIKPFQMTGPKLSFRERRDLREQRLRGIVPTPADCDDYMLDEETIEEIDNAHNEQDYSHDDQQDHYENPKDNYDDRQCDDYDDQNKDVHDQNQDKHGQNQEDHDQNQDDHDQNIDYHDQNQDDDEKDDYDNVQHDYQDQDDLDDTDFNEDDFEDY